MYSKRMFKGSLLILLFLMATGVESAEGLSHLNLLQDVVTQQEAGAVVFRLQFQKPVGRFKEPVFYKKSIQVDFDNAFIKPAKRHFPTGDPLISRVYVVQFTPETVRVRFVLGGEGKDIHKKFHLSKQGRFLVARLDKVVPGEGSDVALDDLLKTIRERDKVRTEEPVVTQQALQPAADPSTQIVPQKKSLPAPGVLQKAANNNPLPVKKLSLTGEKKTSKFLNFQKASANGPPDLMDSGITMFSMLAVVLALVFFVFYLFKKFVLKNGLLGGSGSLIRVLGTGMIAPRKTVALVEVAGEILVLGISNDHIAHLSTIRDEKAIEKIKGENLTKAKLASTFGFRNEKEPLQESGKSADDFRKYLKRFSTDSNPTKEQSIAGVRQMIRKNLGKVQTA